MQTRGKFTSIDYGCNLDNFVVDCSYTVLDWLLIDKLTKADNNQRVEQIKFEEVQELQKISLCFNMLPNGLTFFHKNSQEAEMLSKALKFLMDERHTDLKSYPKDTSLYVPMLQNLDQHSLLDLVLPKSDGGDLTDLVGENAPSEDEQ